METILIVAGSARMLVQAAKNAGLNPLVIDLFGDQDTQAYAKDFRQVTSLAEPDLAPVVDYFIKHYAVTHVVYGSGFECHQESLYYLNNRLIMLGNEPDVFATQLDKPAFFSVLDRLNISHPEVVFKAELSSLSAQTKLMPFGYNKPDCTGGWLIKPMRSQGGLGIKRYHADDDETASIYWQKFQAGTSHSVLFLADGQDMHVVGFNTQWTVCLSETQEFVFSGVVNSADLSDAHKAMITNWLKQMVPVFGLKGLNSLDFIHADGCSYVLGFNPRPSASMQLYSQDLLSGHIQACVGATSVAESSKVGRLKSPLQSGYQIVYAGHDLIIPDHFEWPPWCMDLPKPGNMCRAGQPICSIIAHQKNSQSVVEQLLTKQQFIINKLEGFDRHGIYSQC